MPRTISPLCPRLKVALPPEDLVGITAASAKAKKPDRDFKAGAADAGGNSKEDGPSASASAFTEPEPEDAEGERPKPLPAWLLRGVPAKEAGPAKAAEDSEIAAAEQPPAVVADANGPKPSFGARLTGKAASAAPSVKFVLPAAPPKVIGLVVGT